jgi:hypothetical protein
VLRSEERTIAGVPYVICFAERIRYCDRSHPGDAKPCGTADIHRQEFGAIADSFAIGVIAGFFTSGSDAGLAT